MSDKQSTGAMEGFLSAFFDSLDTAGVQWVVARNAEGLPKQTRNDVDLLIDPAKLKTAAALLHDEAEKHSWVVVGDIRKRLYYSALVAPRSNPKCFLPIDLFGAVEHRGKKIADMKYGLDNRKRNTQGIWTVPPGFEAATTLLKEVVPHGTLKENSRKKVSLGAADDRLGFRRTLSPVLGEKLTEQLRLICVGCEWNLLPEQSIRVREAISHLSPVAILHRLHAALLSFCCLFKPQVSTFVVLVGPDGTGKTTVAKHLCRSLLKAPFKDARYMRTRFGVLPELKEVKRLWLWLTGRRFVQHLPIAPGTENSGMIEPLSCTACMAYSLYYAIDQFLGRATLRLMRSRWNLVVFDRYYYDYFYQLGYSNAPQWWLKLLEILVPRPDLILYIDRNPEDIYAAKPELTQQEIARQQQAIASSFSSWPEFRVVDGNAGVIATCAEAQDLVAARYAVSSSDA